MTRERIRLRVRLHSDEYYKGYAKGFNLGCDLMDMALGRKPGKKLSWKAARTIGEERKGALTRDK